MAPDSEEEEIRTPLLYGSYGTCRGSEGMSPGRGKGVLRESWGVHPLVRSVHVSVSKCKRACLSSVVPHLLD